VSLRLIHADVLDGMRQLEPGSVRCCVTSPPYFGLRDYRSPGQIGLERTPAEYVARLVDVFRTVRDVLAKDGTLWINIGDCYAASSLSSHARGKAKGPENPPRNPPPANLKPKDRLGIPHRLAFALQDDGWWWRDEIVWHKPSPMPTSAKDRTTAAHEFLMMFSTSRRYYYDHAAIAEPVSEAVMRRPEISEFSDNRPAVGPFRSPSRRGAANGIKVRERNRGGRTDGFVQGCPWDGTREKRNRRSVWMIPPQPFLEAHFAVMPEALVEPCILAGSAPGDTVLDPFAGSGTVGVVAARHGRRFVGIELNAEYVAMARRRIAGPLFANADVSATQPGEVA
jgi:DNA modification methylase